MPVLAASTPMSVKTASSCASTNSGGTSWTAVTPTVFWAVSATIALVPWQPAAANAFRSAWIPAPPPESEPAIVKHVGTNALPPPVNTGEPMVPPWAPPPVQRTKTRSDDRTFFLPPPVLTGSGSTGVISARTGTPVTPGYHRQMAVSAALWDEL